MRIVDDVMKLKRDFDLARMWSEVPKQSPPVKALRKMPDRVIVAMRLRVTSDELDIERSKRRG
jgi:hypothetical protein